jgi:hypothetical protein
MSVAINALNLPDLKPSTGGRALALRAIGVQRGAFDAALCQSARELVRAALGSHEHQARAVRSLEKLIEPLGLFGAGHEMAGVLDGTGKPFIAADTDHLRSPHDLVGRLRHFVGHRRRKEERLSVRRQRRHDAPDAWPESHVEHPIGLIQHQHVQVLEFRRTRAHVIEQTSRCRHDDVGRAPEATLLRTRFDAAVHRDARQVGVVRKA